MTKQNVKGMKILNRRIIFRVSEQERVKAEQLIFERKFKNLSQILRTALRNLLQEYEGPGA